MTDRTLLCAECGKEFTFTVAEQEFFRERGFDHDPKRCVECRRKRRRKFRSRGGRPTGTSDGDGASAQPRKPKPRPAPDPASLNDAECTACGEATKVPFVPDGVRPVYCMPCLKKRTR